MFHSFHYSFRLNSRQPTVSAVSRASFKLVQKSSGPYVDIMLREINIESHFTNHLFMVNSNRFLREKKWELTHKYTNSTLLSERWSVLISNNITDTHIIIFMRNKSAWEPPKIYGCRCLVVFWGLSTSLYSS